MQMEADIKFRLDINNRLLSLYSDKRIVCNIKAISRILLESNYRIIAAITNPRKQGICKWKIIKTKKCTTVECKTDLAGAGIKEIRSGDLEGSEGSGIEMLEKNGWEVIERIPQL